MRTICQIFALSCALFSVCAAQTADTSGCPSISVNGPSEVVPPGSIGSWIATVDTKGQALILGYTWSVSSGEIVSGQHTAELKVRVSHFSNLTVTVEISGLPASCPTAESATGCAGLLAPQAELIGVFSNPVSKISSVRIEEVRNKIDASPTEQIYVLHKFRSSTSSSKNKKLLDDLLRTVLGPVEPDRITIVNLPGDTDNNELWLVPPGATPPASDEIKR